MKLKSFLNRIIICSDKNLSNVSHLNNLSYAFERHYSDNELKVSVLASTINVSERTLRRKCIALLGLSPFEALTKYRIEIAKSKLDAGISVGQVALDVGFSTHSHFSTTFKTIVGVTPKSFIKENDN